MGSRRALARRPSRTERRVALAAFAAAAALLLGGGRAGADTFSFPPPWVGNGPFGGGGEVIRDPNAPTQAYLFVPGDPVVYDSTNHGGTWTPSALDGYGVPVFAPSDPLRAYRNVHAQFETSDDGGVTWTFTANVRSGAPVAVSSDNADVVYTEQWVDQVSQLVVSSDAGKTWTPADDGIATVPGSIDPELRLTNIFIDPGDAQHLIVDAASGTWESTDGAATWHPYAPAVSGITAEPLQPAHWIGKIGTQPEISRDSGATWVPLDPGGQPTAPVESSPAKAGVLYTTIYELIDGEPSTEVVRSTDDGVSWTPDGTTPPDAVRATLSLDPSVAADLYIVDYTGDLERSLDGGATWQRAVQGVPDSAPTSIALDPSAPRSAVVVANGRLSETIDGGSHWHALPEPGGTPVQIAGTLARLYLLTKDLNWSEKLWSSSDGGESWHPVLQLPRGGCVAGAAPSDTDVAYVACPDTGLQRSDDGGDTWGQPQALPADPSQSNPPMAISPRNPDVLLLDVGDHVLQRSADAGATWHQVATAGWSFAFSTRTPGTVYAALYGELYRSDDDGLHWRSITDGEGYGAVALGPNDMVYANDQNGFVSGSDNDEATHAGLADAPKGSLATSGTGPGRLWVLSGQGVHSRPGLRRSSPTLKGKVTVHLTPGSTLYGRRGVPVTVHWPAATGPFPVCGYQLWQTHYTTLHKVGDVTPSNTRHLILLAGDGTTFYVYAEACSGSQSEWIHSAMVEPSIYQENSKQWISRTGPWREVTARRASHGHQLVAEETGATLRFLATSPDAVLGDVGYLASASRRSGWPQVRVDGGRTVLVSLHSRTRHFRRFVFVRRRNASRRVLMTITSGRRRTTVDAIVVLRDYRPYA